MKKSILVVIMAVAIVILGGGGYLLFKQKDTNESQVATTGTAANTEEAKPEDNNSKLEGIMANVRSKFSTVKETKICNETNDPNNSLGKPNEYVACAVFWDTRTNYSNEFDEPKDAWGTDAGGSVEVFKDEADAIARGKKLADFQGSFVDPGAFKQSGVYVVRASSELPKSQQDDVTAYLMTQL